MTASRRIASASVMMMMLAALVLATVAPASAQGPPLSGSGEGMITRVVETSSRQAGENRIAERVLEGIMADGPLVGEFTEEVRGVVHGDGRVTFQGTMTFVGTVEGCEHLGEVSVTARLSGRGQTAPTVTEARWALVGSQQVTGHGTVTQVGPEIAYDAHYVC